MPVSDVGQIKWKMGFKTSPGLSVNCLNCQPNLVGSVLFDHSGKVLHFSDSKKESDAAESRLTV